MLKLSLQSNHHGNKYSSELVDRPSVLNSTAKPKLPRHISGLESLGRTKVNNSQLQTNNKYFLDSNTRVEETTNLAVNILRYQLEDSSLQKHLSNLRCNLKHRLAVAIAIKNEELIEMLQQEFQQLEDDCVTTA